MSKRNRELLPTEPRPGEWMANDDFETVVRNTPLVAIDLIVRGPNGRVLLGRRTNEPAKGVWFVPGSRITKNETRAMAFRRVTREELGAEIRIEQARFRGVYEHFYRTNRFQKPGFGTHYLVLAYELRLPRRPAQLPPEQHSAYCWLSPAELVNSPEVHPNTKAYFQNARELPSSEEISSSAGQRTSRPAKKPPGRSRRRSSQ